MASIQCRPEVNALTAFERWARRLTGLLFLAVGGYYCAVYFF